MLFLEFINNLGGPRQLAGRAFRSKLFSLKKRKKVFRCNP